MAVLAVHQEVTAVVEVVVEEVANVVAADEVVLTEPIPVFNALYSNLSAEKSLPLQTATNINVSSKYVLRILRFLVSDFCKNNFSNVTHISTLRFIFANKVKNL